MRRLTALLTIAGALGCASPPPKPAPVPTTPARTTPPPRGGRGTASSGATWDASALAEDVLTRTNIERRGKGLPALTKSMNLMRAAQIQADQMASMGRLDHDLPGAAYPSLSSRLAVVSYTVGAAGENIGEGYRNPAEAVSGWMGSSGHRANILSTKYTQIGTGVSIARNGTQYWAQVFGRPR